MDGLQHGDVMVPMDELVLPQQHVVNKMLVVHQFVLMHGAVQEQYELQENLMEHELTGAMILHQRDVHERVLVGLQ